MREAETPRGLIQLRRGNAEVEENAGQAALLEPGSCDGGELFELKPAYGPSLITALARIDGYPLAILASDPNVTAGALGPAACDKGARHLCLADAFGLPVVIFHDSPGFYVGAEVEAQKIQSKTILFLQALMQCSSPRISVIIRKPSGEEKRITVKSRIDTAIEVDYYKHGGILPYVLREIISKAGPAKSKAA